MPPHLHPLPRNGGEEFFLMSRHPLHRFRLFFTLFGERIPIINNGLMHVLDLIPFDIFVERFHRPSHKRLRLLLAMLALGQLKKHPAFGKEWISESLLERAESVAAFF